VTKLNKNNDVGTELNKNNKYWDYNFFEIKKKFKKIKKKNKSWHVTCTVQKR